MKSNNKVLVTGSVGFIGSHLMKALDDRGVHYDIRKQAFMDINKADNLHAVVASIKPNVIVHLAAISNIQDVKKDPDLALRTNIVGTFNVLRIAHKYKVRVILASSAATKEPERSLYGTTKDCMESLAKMFDNVVTARFYNVYGPRSKSVVNKFVKRIKAGKSVTLNGNTTRDYIHVDDVVDALMSLIDAPKPEKLVEIGTRRSVTLNKLVSMITHILKKKATIVHGKPLNEIQQSRCEVSYSWYRITLEQGIRRLI